MRGEIGRRPLERQLSFREHNTVEPRSAVRRRPAEKRT
jgi:hypothetical protein